MIDIEKNNKTLLTHSNTLKQFAHIQTRQNTSHAFKQFAHLQTRQNTSHTSTRRHLRSPYSENRLLSESLQTSSQLSTPASTASRSSSLPSIRSSTHASTSCDCLLGHVSKITLTRYCPRSPSNRKTIG